VRSKRRRGRTLRELIGDRVLRGRGLVARRGATGRRQRQYGRTTSRDDRVVVGGDDADELAVDSFSSISHRRTATPWGA
jgi:hypothetical protein